MPLYDFHCSDCNKTFELLIKSTDVPVCPECGGANMEKQVSRIAPHGQVPGLINQARTQAAKEGHFSNYKPSERPRSK